MVILLLICAAFLLSAHGGALVHAAIWQGEYRTLPFGIILLILAVCDAVYLMQKVRRS